MSFPLVLVDDTDPNISYSGPWFAVQNTQTNIGNLGIPFLNNLHGVNVDANLSFPFSGSSVVVLGTSITTKASGTQVPTWECFVDNNSIGWSTASYFAENNWIFCQNNQLQDGPHVLSVRAKVSNQQTFWFDQIQYIPSSNLRIDSSDPAIQYSSGWQPLNGIVNFTQIAGSTLTYQFSGISLSWISIIYTTISSPPNSSSATYSIDGQTPTTFLVPAPPSGIARLYNQILFQTAVLSPGHHELVVTYRGNDSQGVDSQPPLSLDYFVVQDAPSSSTSSSSNAPTHAISSSAPSSSSTSSSTTTNHIGAVVGGVIGGGFIMLLLLLIVFAFIRRRDNRRAQALNETSDASLDIVDPFIVPPSDLHPTSTLLSQPYTSNGQSLTLPTTSGKFNHRSSPSDTPGMSSNKISTFPPTNASPASGGSIPPLTTLQFRSSPSLITSSSLPRLPYAGLQTESSMTQVREAETEPVHLRQQSASSRDGDPIFLRHEDSGLRMPAEVVELPPLYTPG
ncbi:hypothetical protein BYT27DRAFT_6442198 [Phlegmacium glaucopus]|nr:hypothetical protein BYT27DRAFT_6442198 [Phlegmacium glaucopus]